MKGDKHLPIALSIIFWVTLSYIFENVVKVLIGRKFDISFLLEVPLWSGETMEILASPRKMPYDKLLFIAFDKDWHKTFATIFTSSGEIILKTNRFLFVKCSQIFKYFFWIYSTSIARRRNWGDLIFRSSLNATDARVI